MDCAFGTSEGPLSRNFETSVQGNDIGAVIVEQCQTSSLGALNIMLTKRTKHAKIKY